MCDLQSIWSHRFYRYRSFCHNHRVHIVQYRRVNWTITKLVCGTPTGFLFRPFAHKTEYQIKTLMDLGYPAVYRYLSSFAYVVVDADTYIFFSTLFFRSLLPDDMWIGKLVMSHALKHIPMLTHSCRIFEYWRKSVELNNIPIMRFCRSSIISIYLCIANNAAIESFEHIATEQVEWGWKKENWNMVILGSLRVLVLGWHRQHCATGTELNTCALRPMVLSSPIPEFPQPCSTHTHLICFFQNTNTPPTPTSSKLYCNLGRRTKFYYYPIYLNIVALRIRISK